MPTMRPLRMYRGPPACRGWWLTRTSVGMLLLVAAALKFRNAFSAQTEPHGLLSSPAVMWIAAGWEGALALLLLCGTNPLATWLVVLITFSAFLTVNALQW